MYYFLDNLLDIKQEYQVGVIEIERGRTDVHAYYRRRADASFADEVAAFVRKHREWRQYCTLILPWQEREPIGDALDPSRVIRVRRHIYAYELSAASQVKYMEFPMRPPWLLQPEGAVMIELRPRPVRGVADGRALLGAIADDTLFITELR